MGGQLALARMEVTDELGLGSSGVHDVDEIKLCTAVREALHEASLAFVAQSWADDLSADFAEVVHQAAGSVFEHEFSASLTRYAAPSRASPTAPCEPAVVAHLERQVVEGEGRRAIPRRRSACPNRRCYR